MNRNLLYGGASGGGMSMARKESIIANAQETIDALNIENPDFFYYVYDSRRRIAQIYKGPRPMGKLIGHVTQHRFIEK